MIRTTRVFRSGGGDYRAIGVRGAPTHTFVQQIFDVLENRLSVPYRQLFAEPVVDEGTSRIDWWSDLEGPVQAFSALPNDRKNALRAKVEDRVDVIREMASALRRSGQDEAVYISELLDAAVRTPNEASWYVVGDQPVLTLWAHELNSPVAADVGVAVDAAEGRAAVAVAATETTIGPVSQPMPDPDLDVDKPVEKRRGRIFLPRWRWWLAWPTWLRWLLLAFLLLLLLWLLRSCVPGLDPFDFSGPRTSAASSNQTSPPDAATEPKADQGRADADKPDSTTPGARDRIVDAPPRTGDSTSAPVVTVPRDVVPRDVAPRGTLPQTVMPQLPVAPATRPDDQPDPVVVAQLEEARLDEKRLREEIARLEAEIAAKQQQCLPAVCGPDGRPLPAIPQAVTPDASLPSVPVTPPTPEPRSELRAQPKPESKVQPLPESEPESETRPEPKPQPDDPPQPQDSPPAQPQPEQSAEESCPAPRPSWEAPEIVLVFDTSGSMALPVGMTATEREALVRQAQAGDVAALQRLTRAMRSGGRKLIDEAKTAIGAMVRKMPPDVEIGYIEFGKCQEVVNENFYDHARRAQLLSKVNAAKPQEGTPLARAIERAGNVIKGDSPGEKSTIIVVTDGYDSCGGDPCAAAAAVSRSKPGVTINVVNLGTDQKVQCIARNGRGRTIMATENSLNDAVVKAADEPPVLEHCR